MIFVDEDKCTGCGDCLQVCPQEGAIVFQQAKAVINHDLCTGCAACMPACPEEAIYEMEAVLMAAEQPQPAQVTEQPTLRRARPAIASTLAAAARSAGGGPEAAGSRKRGRQCLFEAVRIEPPILRVGQEEQGGSPGAAAWVDPQSAAAKGADIRSRTGEACLAARSPALSAGSACTASTADEG